MAQPPADPPPVGAILTGPHWPDRVRVPKIAPAGPQSGDFRNTSHQRLAQACIVIDSSPDHVLIARPPGQAHGIRAESAPGPGYESQHPGTAASPGRPAQPRPRRRDALRRGQGPRKHWGCGAFGQRVAQGRAIVTHLRREIRRQRWFGPRCERHMREFYHVHTSRENLDIRERQRRFLVTTPCMCYNPRVAGICFDVQPGG